MKSKNHIGIKKIQNKRNKNYEKIQRWRKQKIIIKKFRWNQKVISKDPRSHWDIFIPIHTIYLSKMKKFVHWK